VALSPPFLTEPVGMESEHLFTNAVGLLETRLDPQVLLDKMMGVEAELGRDRQKGKDRTVDLDLLYYDDLVMRTPSLILPHPSIATRLFVLAPLAAVAPLHVHPILRLTSLEMLNNLARQSGVEQISWEKT